MLFPISLTLSSVLTYQEKIACRRGGGGGGNAEQNQEKGESVKGRGKREEEEEGVGGISNLKIDLFTEREREGF